MSRIKIFYALVIILTISACSLVDPFVDRRRNAGERDVSKLYVGKSKPDAPAICYNILRTNAKELQVMADEECKKQKTGQKAEFVKETYFTCRILLPNHVYFICK